MNSIQVDEVGPMDYNRPPSVTSGGNEIRIRGKRHDFCLSHKSDSEAVSGSAAAAPARNGSAARECLVRLTVRTETPCIRLLRSLTLSSSYLHGIVHACPLLLLRSSVPIPSCARLRLRESCTSRSWAHYLTASALTHPACPLVSGFVVPPQSRS